MKHYCYLIPIFCFIFSLNAWATSIKVPYHNGTFVYKICFEEQNACMGDTALVKIKNDYISVAYLKGNISGFKKGMLIDDGILRKHKTGIWIISDPKSPQDVNRDDIQACGDNPLSKINFTNKTYWIC